MIGAIDGESESNNSLRNQTEQEGSNANSSNTIVFEWRAPPKKRTYMCRARTTYKLFMAHFALIFLFFAVNKNNFSCADFFDFASQEWYRKQKSYRTTSKWNRSTKKCNPTSQPETSEESSVSC